VFTEARLPSGPILEYLDLGDPQGVPVVYQPGSPSTAGGGVLLDDAARRHGVRLVSVSRPGYGTSSLTPPSLESVGRQVVELADLLGWSTFGTYGSSGGGPYALAAAAVAPDRVTRVVVAAGPGPRDGEVAVLEVVTAEVREFAERLTRLDLDAFRAAMAADRPPNEHYFDDHPAEAVTFFTDLQRALAPYDGFARDNVAWAGPWDIDLSTVTTPVDLFYGDADQMVPLDNGRRLAELMPHATLTVLPGAGHGDITFGLTDRVLGLFAGTALQASHRST
jgi:pimeloyl-ACP methyl ester carboxylesterase